MNLYIADLHFGHTNVIKFDNRPFKSAAEMDHVLIQLWNNRVQAKDHVYIIGDFAYRNNRSEEWYLQQLNGHKHLVIGNHDGKLLQNDIAMKYFESVSEIMYIEDGESRICACHYPICEWNGYRKGHLHIYGHIHNRKEDTYYFMRNKDRAYNAGCMINHYTPVSLKELIKNNQQFHMSE